MQLNAFGVCHNICFQHIRQVSNLLKSAISNKNSENNNNYYYYNSNKITIMRCRLEVFFRQISAYLGHWVYFGLSSNRMSRLCYLVSFWRTSGMQRK